MTDQTYQSFDFRNAGATDHSVRALKSWLGKTAGVFSDSWEAISSTTVELRCKNVLSRTFGECIEGITSESIGCEMKLGPNAIPTFVHLPCQALIAVVGYVVGTGTPLNEDAEDRKLTSIEESLGQMILEALAGSLSQAWAGKDPLPIQLGPMDDAPQRSRLFSPSDLVLVTQIEFTVAEATAMVFWLLPRQDVDAVLESVSKVKLRRSANNPRAIVEQLSLDLIGLLGQSQMSMGALKDLKVGDVVVLDQRIDQPITLNIGDETHFQGWPGRIGNQQGVEIAEVK